MAGCDSSGRAPARTGVGADADPTAAAAADAAERARSGSPDWRVRSVGPAGAVEGYTDTVSVEPGDEFGLYVSTTAPGFRVSAYRVGWYGGAQARLVWRSGRVAGRVQSGPRMVTFTDTVRADWKRSLAVHADGWPQGAYLLRLDAENGHQRYVPLIVRSRSAAGRTVLMHAPATWQAYNLWGGHNLYEGKGGAYGSRSLAVSFDRPYDKNGAEKFLVYERAAVVLAERLGIPLAYTTGVDVHLAPAVLAGATAVVSSGTTSTGPPSSGGMSPRPATAERTWRSSAPTPATAGSGWNRTAAPVPSVRSSASRATPRTTRISWNTAPWRPPTSACRPPPTRSPH